jgi:hypothetical protein
MRLAHVAKPAVREITTQSNKDPYEIPKKLLPSSNNEEGTVSDLQL